MKKNNVISLIICFIVSFSLVGCNLKDDYILKTNENSNEELSKEKVDEIFDTENIKDLMDKLKTTPKEVSDKMDEVDSDTERVLRELNDKAEELTDALNNLDIEQKSEDIKTQFDDISNKLDEVKERVENTKDQIKEFKDPIDETQVTDTVDEFKAHMDNLQSAINRIGN